MDGPRAMLCLYRTSEDPTRLIYDVARWDGDIASTYLPIKKKSEYAFYEDSLAYLLRPCLDQRSLISVGNANSMRAAIAQVA